MDAFEILQSFLFSVLLFIDAIVYTFVSWVYKIILVLCQINILGNDFEINGLVSRVYVIVGVVVLFLVAYSLLKSMVNPDEAIKGKKSPVKIISNVVISVVLIAVVPYIFEFAMGFQRALLTRNTLGSLILGSAVNVDDATVDSTSLINEGGNTIAANVLKAFIHPKYSECIQVGVSKDNPTGYNCSNIVLENGQDFDTFWANVAATGDFMLITNLNKNVVWGSGDVTYYWLISTVAGVFVLYVLIVYCFDIALRAIKLAVFQLIAPLPILSRLLPGEQGEKVFSNWIKACLSTFLEVFIRLAILFFAVLLVKVVVQNFPNLFGAFSSGASLTVALVAQTFVIIGIIMFVKKAPEIIKEMTGLDGGKYGKSLVRGVGMMAATLGGGATAAIRTMANDSDNKWDKSKSFGQNMFNKFKQGAKGLSAWTGGARRGLYHGYKTEKLGDMPKAAGTAASNTIAHRAAVKAAGGNLKYYTTSVKDKAKDVQGWVSGSFDAQQKILDQINLITKEADTIKTNTESAVKEKKYVFSMKDNGQVDTYTSSTGETITIDDTTSLSAVDSIIKSLQGTGSAADAKLADKLSNDIQIRAKQIGKKLTQVASGAMSEADFEKDNIVKTISGDASTKLFDVKDKMGIEINQAKQSFETLKDRIAVNPTIADFAQVKDKQRLGKVNSKLSDISMDQASDLSDALKMEAATIQREIALEQERRKAKEKK